MRISLFTSYNKQERIYLWGIIMIKTLFKHISKYYKDTFVLAIAGVAVGVLVGLVDAAFGLGLNACTAIRTKYFWYLIWFLPLGGVFIWFIYHQFGKSVANGMKMVFHVGLGKNTKLPIRMVPLSVIGTWTTHLFGGSAGREGVAVQIGAAVSNNIGRLVDKTIDIENSRKMFLITGMAAGFSGLFCTPLAAIFFALEVLVAGKLEYHALIPATVASISAAFTSRAPFYLQCRFTLKTGCDGTGLWYRWFFICSDSSVSAFKIRFPFFFACKKGSDYGICCRNSYDDLSSGKILRNRL